MKPTKSHIARILFCAGVSIALIHTTAIMVGLSIYSIYDWWIYAWEQGIEGFGEQVGPLLISSVIYHYTISLLVIVFLFKWVAMPKRFLPERRGKDENKNMMVFESKE